MPTRTSAEDRRFDSQVLKHADDDPLDRLLEYAEVKENEYPYPGSNGADLFSAALREYPGTMAFGPTAERAKANLRGMLVAELDTEDADRRGRLKASEVHVQFNHRITPAQKADIARRADLAKLSVRQFVLNQCLRAPVYSPPEQAGDTGTPPERAWG